MPTVDTVPSLEIDLSDASTGLTLVVGTDPSTGQSRWRVRDASGNTYLIQLGADGSGPGGIGRALRLVLDTGGSTVTPDATMTLILNGLLNNAEVDFYTGTPPRSAKDAANATLLATGTIASPAGTNPPDMLASNRMTIHVASDFIVADGTVGWARVRLPDGSGYFDGLVGLAGSGAPFIANTLTWTVPQTMTLTAFIATTGI